MEWENTNIITATISREITLKMKRGAKESIISTKEEF